MFEKCVAKVLWAYRGFLFFERQILGNLGNVVFAGITIIILVEVFRRYIFGQSFLWAGGVVVYSVTCIAFLLFGLAQRSDRHLRVTLLIERLNKKARAICEVAISIISLVYSVILSRAAFEMLALLYEKQVVYPGARIPLWYMYLALLIGTIFFAIAMIDRLVVNVRELKK